MTFGTQCWPPHGSGRAPGSGWFHGPCGETGERILFLRADDGFSSGCRKLERLVRYPSKDANRQVDLRARSSEAKYGLSTSQACGMPQNHVCHS